MSDVSVTIASDDKPALVAAATMLLTLADKIPAIELDDLQPSRIALGKDLAQATALAETCNQMAADGADTETIKKQVDPVTAFGMRGVMPPPPVQQNTNPVEVDSDGLPWDVRIHSGGKSKIKNGQWKKKKGIEADEVARVETELRALMAIPVPAADSVPQVPAADSVPQVPSADSVPPVPATDSVPPVPATDSVPHTPAPCPMTYAEFLRGCSAKMTAGKINMDQINRIIEQPPFGITGGLQMIASRSDLIPHIWAAIDAV